MKNLLLLLERARLLPTFRLAMLYYFTYSFFAEACRVVALLFILDDKYHECSLIARHLFTFSIDRLAPMESLSGYSECPVEFKCHLPVLY